MEADTRFELVNNEVATRRDRPLRQSALWSHQELAGFFVTKIYETEMFVLWHSSPEFWSRWRESNPRPEVYKTPALAI